MCLETRSCMQTSIWGIAIRVVVVVVSRRGRDVARRPSSRPSPPLLLLAARIVDCCMMLVLERGEEVCEVESRQNARAARRAPMTGDDDAATRAPLMRLHLGGERGEEAARHLFAHNFDDRFEGRVCKRATFGVARRQKASERRQPRLTIVDGRLNWRHSRLKVALCGCRKLRVLVANVERALGHDLAHLQSGDDLRPHSSRAVAPTSRRTLRDFASSSP